MRRAGSRPPPITEIDLPEWAVEHAGRAAVGLSADQVLELIIALLWIAHYRREREWTRRLRNEEKSASRREVSVM